jgi:hypothetical protein
MAPKKKKKSSIELTLWDIVLSYPDLHEPKPYKGKVYYRTDAILDADDAQIGKFKKAVKKVCVDAFGEDKSEWPESVQGKYPFIFDGDERTEQKGYAGKKYIVAQTQTPVPVVDPKGKAFNAQMVKGGMFANIAVNISAWEYEGDEGVSVYLQGVQIDTSKASLNFGGGRSIAQMFKRGEDTDVETQDSDEDDDEADQPRSAKKKIKPSREVDDEDDSSDDEEDKAPVKKNKPKRDWDEDDEE